MATQALAQRGATDIATASDHPMVKFRGQLEQRASEFKMVLPSHITPEKFQRTVLTAAQTNPDILRADRQSLLNACMKAAQDGLVPDGREAALVTFKTRKKIDGEWMDVLLAQYMPMVYGLRKKILQSGEIKDIQTSVVYRQEIEQGLFIYEEGTERTLRHKPLLDPDFEPTDDDIAAAYSVATLNDGSRVFEVMRRSEINKVRQMSQTGALGKTDRQGKSIPPKGPWVDWFPEMAKKTVMRRHSKSLPMSSDVVDIEADELTATASVAHVLNSEVPDAPKPVALPARAQLDDEEDHDPETGEVAASREAEEAEARDRDPEPDPKPAAKPKAKKEPKADPKPEPDPEPEPAADDAEEEDAGEPDQGGDDAGTEPAAAADLGDESDWQVWLDEFGENLNRQPNVIEVNSYWSRCQETLKGAPPAVQTKAETAKTTRVEELKSAAQGRR